MSSDIIASNDQKSQSAATSGGRPGSPRRFRRWMQLVVSVALLGLGWLMLRPLDLGGDDRFVGIWQIAGFGPPGTVSVARFRPEGSVDIETVVELKPRFRQIIPWTWRVSEGNLILHIDTPRFGGPLQQLWAELKMKFRGHDMSVTIPLRIRSVDEVEIKLERIEERFTMPELYLRRINAKEAEKLLQSRMTAPFPAPPLEEDESR